MKEIIYPEATLIDIKRISKDCQKKWQAIINYSRLFDLKEKYRCPKKQDSFFGTNCSYYVYHLTKNMKIINDNIMHACAKTYSGGFHDKDYEKVDNNNMFGIRPVFKYSDIKDYCSIVEELAPGYLIVTFGCYPQRKIGRLADYAGSKIYYSDEGYTLRVDGEEVLYNVISIQGEKGKYVEKNGNLYLIEPVRFLVDIKKNFAISEFCLIEMRPNLKLRVIIFENTTFYKFLNAHFVPELMQSITKQNEIAEIEAEENPVIKDLIDSILALINNTCLEIVVKEELQSLINEYNNDLDKEKEKKPTIELSLETKTTPEERFIENLQSLYSKITNFPYYLESRIIYSCLNLDKDLETNNELYKDIKNIFTYILPTLPSELRISYQDSIIEILKFAEKLIINLYKTPTNEKINIELIIREELQPLLASIYKDITTNFININLNEIIEGIFASSTDLYLTNLFELINDIVREIEILTENNKSEEYRSKLKELLNIESKTKTSSDLMKLYIDLIKLKAKLEEKETKKENLERRKIRRKLI